MKVFSCHRLGVFLALGANKSFLFWPQRMPFIVAFSLRTDLQGTFLYSFIKKNETKLTIIQGVQKQRFQNETTYTRTILGL